MKMEFSKEDRKGGNELNSKQRALLLAVIRAVLSRGQGARIGDGGFLSTALQALSSTFGFLPFFVTNFRIFFFLVYCFFPFMVL